MGTPWTLTRLVRWRVRDLASCFLACRIPLEEERDGGCSQLAIEAKDEHRSRRIDTKPSRKRGRRRGNILAGDGNSSWTLFKDEDYIVLCFKEEEMEKEDGRSFQVDLELYSSRSVASNKTSDSSQSDASTASFSFPVLGQEWSGSPAQMPKPAEDLFLREDKICSSAFQCCRF